MPRKKTQEEFERELEEKRPDIEVLGTYINSKTKIKVRCGVCHEEWETIPDTLFRGCNCPKCGTRESSKKNMHDFKSEIEEKHPGRFEILGEYKGRSMPIETKCSICGHIWFPQANNLMNGHGCPECAKVIGPMKKRKTNEEFAEELEKTHPGEFEVLSNYTGCQSEVKVRCKKCGYTWSSQACVLIRGKGCPICNGHRKTPESKMLEETMRLQKKQEREERKIERENKEADKVAQAAANQKRRLENFQTKFDKFHKNQFEILKYTKMGDIVVLRCKNCGAIYKVIGDISLKKSWNCDCRLNIDKMEAFRQEYYKKFPDSNIILSGDYINRSTPIEAECKICGHKWNPLPSTLMAGHGCQKCYFHKDKSIPLDIDDFQNRIDGVHAGKIKLLGKSEKGKAQVDVECLVCGYTWSPSRHDLLDGHGCPHCAVENFRKTTEEYKFDLEKKAPGKFEVIGEYESGDKPITIKCKNCGRIWTAPRAAGFLARPQCGVCSAKGWRPPGDFEREVEEKHPGQWEFLTPYKNMTTKILVKCNVCGKEHEYFPKVLLGDTGCVNCHKTDTKKFQEKLDERYPGKFEVVGEYVDHRTPIEVRCLDCGHERVVNPRNIIKHGGCPYCAGLAKKTTEQFMEEIETKFPNKFEVIGEYVNSNTPIEIRCLKCGRSWFPTPSNLLMGHGCPVCNESNGETFIAEVLSNLEVEFAREYRIKECRGALPLPFDFAIFHNKVLVGFIEFDGRQHTEAVNYFGGEDGLRDTQRRDEIKNNYCKNNNIPLLRVPYTYTEDEVKDSVKIFIKKIGAVG